MALIIILSYKWLVAKNTMWRFILWISILLASKIHGGFSEVVDCFDQKESCVCNESEAVCEFKLEIEELQTFTSYVVTDNDLLTRGTPGDTYFLNETGYHPAVPDDEALPEVGSCYLRGTLVNDKDFTEQSCSIPMTVDGVSYRRYIAVNGRIPGPTLIVTEDQLVKVTVMNGLTSEAITIHWHGMHQKGTPWMDGVGFISQYPIGPGETFDYIFKATPAGTHWYHSHVGAQRTDGLFGALVVQEKNNFFRDVVTPKVISNRSEPGQTIFDNPSRYTLTLLDWQREASLDLFVKIHSTLGFYPQISLGNVPTNRDSLYNPRTTSSDGVEVGPVPYWSGLINGRGRMNDSIRTPLSIFNVSRDSMYRFRIIGAQSLYAYKFSIDSHKLRVIATDGHFIEPVEVDYIIVHSGERYDFILESYEDKSGDAFWIRAKTLENQQQNREHSARAILIYRNAANDVTDWRNGYSQINSPDRNCDSRSKCVVLNCPFKDYVNSTNQTCIHLTQLRALFPVSDDKLPKFGSTPDCPDCLQFFNFGFEGKNFTSAINGKNFELPVVAYQTSCGQYDRDQADSEIDTCSKCSPEASSDCKCINVVQIANKQKTGKDPKTIIMVFSAVGDMPSGLDNFSHPIHLHGHSFHVLYIGHGEYDSTGKLIDNSPDVDCGDLLCRNPTWGNDTMPMDVVREAVGREGRIKNTAILKDTVIVPAGGYVVIAFQADNPGYWFLHCHIEVHQLEGMGVMIEEYPSDKHPKPPSEINNQGNFRWNTEDYNKFVKKGETCKGEVTKRIALIVGLSAGGLVIIILIIFLCICCCIKKRCCKPKIVV